ncbi:hypothetical protein CH299_27970 [Rhodococcus sp. 14-2686-1-2]|nr:MULTISPECIES: isochorismatase family protein [unclassified Rhodococcus (in: high G+C Gram-positive bacteria)]OZE93188.1 hypothetical protein CH301_27450 [Rhodococcus sp. 15-1189-1-1a]OZF08306.1 hypothetical protein CH299_27970 [Rhodococcus sp. 14-2686-1-2]
MSIFNTAIDRTMRGLVTWRMRPQIAYGAKDTAIIVVTPRPNMHPDDLPNGARLMRWARNAGICVIITTTTRSADVDAPVSPPPSSGDGLDPRLVAAPDSPTVLAENEMALEPFPGLSAFTNPSLSTTLADRHLDRVIVVGSRTDIEIDSTARDALESGLHTTVIGDCCTGSSPAGHRATIDITLPRLVHAVMNIDDLPTPTR